MRSEDLSRIEAELGVSLPTSYREFQIGRDSSNVDSTSIADDANFVIERSREYRKGFVGMISWPDSALYVGDEDDACPYLLDCTTGKVVQTDHGDLTLPPLQGPELFKDFAKNLEFVHEDAHLEMQNRKPWWKFW